MTTFQFEQQCVDPRMAKLNVGPVVIGVCGGWRGPPQIAQMQAILAGKSDGKLVVFSNYTGVSAFRVGTDNIFYFKNITYKPKYKPAFGCSIEFSLSYDDHKEEIDKFIRFMIVSCEDDE